MAVIFTSTSNSIHPSDKAVRQILIVSESDPGLPRIRSRISHLNAVLDACDAELQQSKSKPNKQRQLGSETLLLIYPLNPEFSADHFCALADSLVGGGYLLLVAPEKLFERLRQSAEDHQKLKPDYFSKHKYPMTLFRFLQHLIQEDPVCQLGDEWDEQVCSQIEQRFADCQAMITLSFKPTRSQAQAAASIERLNLSRRRRCLLISGGRGRGKSAIIGEALGQIAVNSAVKLVVCSLYPTQSDTLLRHFQLAVNRLSATSKSAIKDRTVKLANGSCLTYQSPTALLLKADAPDLLVIEEAASIPVSLLRQLRQACKHIIFSTTTFGYEGQGRGFELRFVPELNPNRFNQITLVEPIRWGEQDHLEKLMHKAFLLDASNETADLTESLPDSLPASALTVEQIQPSKLLTDEALLRQIFRLLLSAHYKTSLNDLEVLLSGHGEIWIVRYQDYVLAVALTFSEGDFTAQQAAELINGTRKPKGNLTPQLLCWNYPNPRLAQFRFRRIYRISVQHKFRRLSLASLLVQAIRKQAQSRQEILSTSFSVEPGVVAFWRRNQFIAVNLSQNLAGATGMPSLLMLDSGAVAGNEILSQSLQSAPEIIIDRLRQMPGLINDACLLTQVVKSAFTTRTRQVASTPQQPGKKASCQRQLIRLFSQGKRPFEVARFAIGSYLFELLQQKDLEPLNRLTDEEFALLIRLCLLSTDNDNQAQPTGRFSQANLKARLQEMVRHLLT